MKNIPEKLLHFIWKYQLFEKEDLKTVSGDPVIINHPGENHSDAGPDFFNARIRIGQTDWAGNVEIHVNASDWLKHGHQTDRAYDNVILHVVHFYDCEITDSQNNIIPALTLPCPNKLIQRYSNMVSGEVWLPCEESIKSINTIYLHQWLTNLQIERLQGKYLRIKTILDRTNSDWEQMLFALLASCFGIPLNQLPFEMLANSINIRQVLRVKDDLFRIEAWLFGVAGFLTGNLPSDYYSESLLKEYLVLKGKNGKDEVPLHIWKFLRLRPGSFPTVRLALLASLIHHEFPLSEKISAIQSKSELYDLFRIRASDYWNTHYLFGKESTSRIKYTGRTFIDTLAINAIAPVLFAMGKLKDQPAKVELSIRILEEVAPEKNGIIEKWRKHGVVAKSAFESQALIQLYNFYCKQKRCLDCQIGLQYLSRDS